MFMPTRQAFYCNQVKSVRGVAAVEFVFFLPVIVGFLLLGLWVFRTQQSVLLAGIEADIAEAEATVELLEQPQALQNAEVIPVGQADDITLLVHGFDAQLNVSAGRATGIGQVDTGHGFSGIQSVGTVHVERQSLTHAWENQVFDFPQSQRQQQPLTIPPSVRGIAPQWTKLDAFRQLLDFSGVVASGSISTLNSLDGKRNSADRDIDDALANVRRQIQSLKSRIGQLESQSPRDDQEIARLRSELRRNQQYERDLSGGKAAGTQAGSAG